MKIQLHIIECYLIFILALFISCSTYKQLTLGKYGIYADYSHYTELLLKNDSTYIFTHLPFNRVQINKNGNWLQKNEKIFLTGIDKDSSHIQEFKIYPDKICPIKQEKEIPCLMYQKDK